MRLIGHPWGDIDLLIDARGESLSIGPDLLSGIPMAPLEGRVHERWPPSLHEIPPALPDLAQINAHPAFLKRAIEYQVAGDIPHLRAAALILGLSDAHRRQEEKHQCNHKPNSHISSLRRVTLTHARGSVKLTWGKGSSAKEGQNTPMQAMALGKARQTALSALRNNVRKAA